jgi:hypothetical protein
MKKTIIYFLTVVCFLILADLVFAAEFTQKPSVTEKDGAYTITFKASESTDVEVAVLDKNEQVICHLAAGVIGGKQVPPPPLKPGLSQSITWDGKDDKGNKAEGKELKVRVRLGMKPLFDGFILDKPAATGGIKEIAVGPKGELYLWHGDCTANPNQGSTKLKIISRNGKYVHTLMPYPADIPKEKAVVLGALVDDEGDLVPRVYNIQQLSLTDRGYGARGKTFASSGCVDAKGRVYWFMAEARLAALEPDGSPVYDHVLSKPLLPGFKAVKGWGSLALSGDGKHLYVVGFANGKNRYDKNAIVSPCVWRIDLASLKTEAFIGDPSKPGKEKGLLAKPVSIAYGKGLVYIADPGAGRIAVFKETDRSFAGEIKIKGLISTGTDLNTGAVYASVRTGKNMADLVKFSNYSDAKEVCRIKLPKSYSTHRIAVDSTAQPVRIILGSLRYGGNEINCYEDTGDTLISIGDPRKDKAKWAPGPRDLTVDRTRGELYIKFDTQLYYRIQGKTGKVLDTLDLRKTTGRLGSAGTQLVVSPDGSLVAHSWKSGLRRLDRKGKPLNWEGRDTNAIPYGGIMTFQQRYMVMPSPDEIYIMLPPGYRGKKGGGNTCLNVLDTKGNTKRTLIWQCSQGAVPRIDAKGNIYIADMVKPKGRSYPEFFDGKLERYKHGGSAINSMAKDPDVMSRFWESSMYGSIIKFPPSGGIIWFSEKLPADVEGKPSEELLAKPKVVYERHIGYNFKPVEVQGAEWVRFGYAPYGVARGAGFCMCEGVGFDVDAYGRIFYPNLGQFRIEVVDTANNWIGSFGKYGNQDDGQQPAYSQSLRAVSSYPPAWKPSGLEAEPEAETRNPKLKIPFAWPTYVAVEDDYAYVNDTLSNRVVRVKLDYSVSETCSITSR